MVRLVPSPEGNTIIVILDHPLEGRAAFDASYWGRRSEAQLAPEVNASL